MSPWLFRLLIGVLVIILSRVAIRVHKHRYCYICHTYRKGLLEPAPAHGMYGDYLPAQHYYHVACLVDVLSSPEAYGHEEVDRALEIAERVKERHKRNALTAEKQRKQIEAVKDVLFWADGIEL